MIKKYNICIYNMYIYYSFDESLKPHIFILQYNYTSYPRHGQVSTPATQSPGSYAK